MFGPTNDVYWRTLQEKQKTYLQVRITPWNAPALFYVKDETKRTKKNCEDISELCLRIYRITCFWYVMFREDRGCFWMLLQLVFVKYMFLIILFLVVVFF